MRNRPSVLVCCWRGDRPVRNLGEWLIEPILGRLGYGVRYYPHQRVESGEPCLLVIGSEFHRLQVDRLLKDCREVWIWGQGNGYCREWAVDVTAAPYAQRVKVCALRGPITAEQSRVTGVPLCDPGFLAADWPLETGARQSESEVLYVPHWEERAGADERLKAMGADAWIDVLMPGDQVAPILRRIASARFVLTGTLHTMIFCLARRVPCALSLPPDRPETNMPQKWRDVFATMTAAPPAPVPDVAAGLEWWSAIGSKLVLPDTRPLLESFPHGSLLPPVWLRDDSTTKGNVP